MADSTDERSRGQLMQLVFGFFPAAAIYACARLRIADLLAGGAKSADELAGATATHAPSLHRLLRALAYLGVLTEVEPGSFGLTTTGTLLRSDAPDSMWATSVLFGGEGVWRSWGELVPSVETGEPAFSRIFGEQPMAPEGEASEFNQAMSEGTRQLAPVLVGAHDFGGFREIVDVGGGNGTLIAAILAANPGQRGVLFDTRAGVAEAPPTLEAAGVADRCRVVEGDFFDHVPPDGDAYVLKSVIHDWDDERSVRILQNCRRAMADGAKVLIVESVLPAEVQPSFGMLGVIMSDLNMLVCTGGRERTETEFSALLDRAGLKMTSVKPIPGPFTTSLIEAEAA
jgi:orsellinic acid C2-O-methyltransferase